MGSSIRAMDLPLHKYGLEKLPFGVREVNYFAAARKFATAAEVICASDSNAAADNFFLAAESTVKIATSACTVFRKKQGARFPTVSRRIVRLKQARTELTKAKRLLQKSVKDQSDPESVSAARDKVTQAELNLVALLRRGRSRLSHARADLIEARSNLEISKELKQDLHATVKAKARVRLAELDLVALLRARPSRLSRARADLIEARSNLELTKELKQDPQAVLMSGLTELYNLLATHSQKVEDTADIPTIAGYAINLTFAINFALALTSLFVTATALAVLAVDYFFARNAIYAAKVALSVSHGKNSSSSHNKIWDGVLIFSAAQLLIGTTLGLLNTLAGLGPNIFASLGGYTFGACLSIYAAQEGHYLYRAWRKSWDIDYFIAERKEAIVAEIKLLVDRRTWLDHLLAKAPIALEDEYLDKSREKIQVMGQQIVALTFYKQEEANKKTAEYTNIDYPEPMDTDSRRNRAIAHILISKEKEKKEKHRKKCITFLVAGTLITTSAAIMLPPAMILALAILSMIVALLKGGQIVNLDYGEKATQAFGAEEKEVFLTEAVINILAKNFQKTPEEIKALYDANDILAIKAAVSEKDKETWINAQARKKYNPGVYLSTKACDAKEALSTKAKNASNVLCSFFGVTHLCADRPESSGPWTCKV